MRSNFVKHIFFCFLIFSHPTIKADEVVEATEEATASTPILENKAPTVSENFKKQLNLIVEGQCFNRLNAQSLLSKTIENNSKQRKLLQNLLNSRALDLAAVKEKLVKLGVRFEKVPKNVETNDPLDEIYAPQKFYEFAEDSVLFEPQPTEVQSKDKEISDLVSKYRTKQRELLHVIAQAHQIDREERWFVGLFNNDQLNKKNNSTAHVLKMIDDPRYLLDSMESERLHNEFKAKRIKAETTQKALEAELKITLAALKGKEVKMQRIPYYHFQSPFDHNKIPNFEFTEDGFPEPALTKEQFADTEIRTVFYQYRKLLALVMANSRKSNLDPLVTAFSGECPEANEGEPAFPKNGEPKHNGPLGKSSSQNRLLKGSNKAPRY